MRKIRSKYEEARRTKRNQIIIGGVLIFVMLFSVLGYAFQGNILNSSGNAGNSGQTVTYNGVDFTEQNGFWVLQSNGGRFVFTYNPQELASQNLPGVSSISLTSGGLLNQPLYLESYEYSAKSELSTNLKNFASEIMLLIGSPDCSKNTIILENGTLGARQEENCIYISGQGEDLIKLSDRLLYKIMGIEQ